MPKRSSSERTFTAAELKRIRKQAREEWVTKGDKLQRDFDAERSRSKKLQAHRRIARGRLKRIKARGGTTRGRRRFIYDPKRLPNMKQKRSSKPPTAKQLAARKKFIAMVRSGKFKRTAGAKRKPVAKTTRTRKPPTAKQLAARKRFVAMVKSGKFKRAAKAKNPFFGPSVKFRKPGYRKHKKRVRAGSGKGGGFLDVSAHTKWGLRRKTRRAKRKLESVFNPSIGGFVKGLVRRATGKVKVGASRTQRGRRRVAAVGASRTQRGKAKAGSWSYMKRTPHRPKAIATNSRRRRRNSVTLIKKARKVVVNPRRPSQSVSA